MHELVNIARSHCTTNRNAKSIEEPTFCAEGPEDEASSELMFEVEGLEICAWDAADLHRKQCLLHDVWANWVVDAQLARERRAKQ